MSSELYSFVKAISLIALGVMAFSFGALMFAFIDKAFPDPLQYGGFFPRGLTTALAALIIAFPLYLVLMWRLGKAASTHTEGQEPKIAKWLTYIVLVLVAATILGDLIAVLAGFLGGELTTRFVLKALTILVIASTIFGYYLWSLQRKSGVRLPVAKVLGGVVVVAIVAAVGYGLTLVGTPAQQRLLQFDQRRVSDLQQISFAIDAYWDRNGALPGSLEDLRDSRYFVQSITDPKTGEPYEYQPTDEDSYGLCAAFETDSSQYERGFPKPFSEQPWDHDAGRTCFDLEVHKPLPLTPAVESIPAPIPVR